MNHGGSADDDWSKAEDIYKKPVSRLLFWLNQPLFLVEKKIIEPVTAWADTADIFRLAERVSPMIEAFGVIAIPVVLFFAAQGYQQAIEERELERIQQQAVKDYLSQLSTILLDTTGDLREPANERLRAVTTATTLTLLRDPGLSGARKGQVIAFLSEMGLINQPNIYGPKRLDDSVPTISLRNADLSFVQLDEVNMSSSDLQFVNLYQAQMNGADLSDAKLNNSHLIYASLNSSDLSGADFSSVTTKEPGVGNDWASSTRFFLGGTYTYSSSLLGARLRGANLKGANLDSVDLSNADLYEADLEDTNLKYAYVKDTSFSGTNLQEADLRSLHNWTQEQIAEAYLCRTKLPTTINLDPNRDCHIPRVEYLSRRMRQRTIDEGWVHPQAGD
ncbi:MAG: pentapeptide repeat-containing protein [Cyanobacteria bacterium P01_D01_bin.105]